MARSAVAHSMDDLLAAEFDPAEALDPRLPLFTLSEAHQLLDVLQHVAAGDDEWAAQARHFAAELAARVPSREA